MARSFSIIDTRKLLRHKQRNLHFRCVHVLACSTLIVMVAYLEIGEQIEPFLDLSLVEILLSQDQVQMKDEIGHQMKLLVAPKCGTADC